MTKRICSVEGCDLTYKARGYCHNHYQKLRYNGLITRLPQLRLDDLYTDMGPDECWQWRGTRNSYGYGRFGDGRQYGTVMAHRIVYEKFCGPIPDGLQLDHLCRNRACVNPAHLEPIELIENVRRGLVGYAIRTVCKNAGHDLTLPGAIRVRSGARTCRECDNARWRRWYQENKGKSLMRWAAEHSEPIEVIPA